MTAPQLTAPAGRADRPEALLGADLPDPQPGGSVDPSAPRPRRRPAWVWPLRAVWAVLLVVGVLGLRFAWWHEFEFRMRVIEPGAVYQTSVIRPLALPRVVEDHGIRTVLDLRNDPAKQPEVAREAAVLDGLGVRHAHVPMSPDPSLEQIDAAAKILLDPDNHPVLVHCHHGEGRSVMMAALYRILSGQTDFDDAVFRTARLPSSLLWLAHLLPASFDDDNFKVDRMRSYVESRR